jgi:DNA-binding response OmpR family regulator
MTFPADKKKKILVVDDDMSFARMIQLLLVRHGYDVYTSSGVADAKRKLGDEHGAFDLIVLDLMMPEENGFDFLNWKESAPESIKGVPVLINTAKKVNDEESDFLLARSKGIVEKGMDFTSIIVKKVLEILSL